MLVKQSRLPMRQIVTEGILPSPLKIALYRSRGARIGKNVSIGLGTVLVAEHLEIGDDTHIGFGTVLRGREIKIGRHVKIGSASILDVEKIFIDDDAKINEQVFAGGPTLPESSLHVGKRTIIMQYTFLNTTMPLVIKDGAGVGGKCNIFTHGSWQDVLDGYPVKFAPVTIGENVWIPWQVFIMPGVTIGDGATIGAGSLVVKDIPAGALAAGAPAKVMRTAEEYPVALPPEKQQRILQDIMDEFRSYLQYFRFDLTETGNVAGWRTWELRGREYAKGLTWRLYFAMDQCPGELPPAANRQTFMSLRKLDPSLRSQMDARGAVWFDLEAKQRSEAGNDCAEELAGFLARYGTRCERVASGGA